MSNGSNRPSGASLPRPAPRRKRWPPVLLAACVSLLAGCQHETLQRRPNLQAELATVTSEDLLGLAIWHARSGDLLRAEQYLSAARQRGHDDAAVAYWLVRVCVTAGRYRSAVTHAADYLRDHPSDWSFRLVVATLHEALGDHTRAELELEHITKTAPAMPLPHYRLAMLYRARAADQARAKMHLEEYVRLAPDGRHAVEARAALSEVADLANGPKREPSLGTIDSMPEELQ
jgi:predicted Zn-dependent protease